MKLKVLKSCFIWTFILIFINNSCVEPIDIKTITFEDALVVEATITDEYKYQEINLSRTYELEQDGPSPETNAVVEVVDDLQNTYKFEEAVPGKYISSNKFSAIQGSEYELKIITTSGENYYSSPTKLTNGSQIDSVFVYTDINEDGVEGVSITLNSFNPSGNSRYYRYEYEETYKIIAQNWSPYEAIAISNTFPYEVDTVYKTKQDKVCFKTNYSTGITQNETNSLTEDRITNFNIRFIPSDDAILKHRYSILIKQYVQSRAAYIFYKVLNELSGSESLFSQNQPGFISGNLFSTEDKNKKVIGFFEASSISSKRIFFNRRDILSTGPPAFACRLLAPPLTDRFSRSPLVESILAGSLRFYGINDGTSFEPGQVEGNGPYVMVPPVCGDCTVSGGSNSNVKPDFWIE